jgi:hypothetical protein
LGKEQKKGARCSKAEGFYGLSYRRVY